MNYLIECRNIFLRKDLDILNEELEVIGSINYKKQGDNYNLTCFIEENQKTFKVKTNPLKLKPKHIIYDEGENQLAKVSIGVKIIHSIIEANKYYFVKSAFWRIFYQVYDNRVIIGSLEIIRIDKKRYYKINTKEKDDVIALALFLLAQAVRMKAIMH